MVIEKRYQHPLQTIREVIQQGWGIIEKIGAAVMERGNEVGKKWKNRLKTVKQGTIARSWNRARGFRKAGGKRPRRGIGPALIFLLANLSTNNPRTTVLGVDNQLNNKLIPSRKITGKQTRQIFSRADPELFARIITNQLRTGNNTAGEVDIDGKAEKLREAIETASRVIPRTCSKPKKQKKTEPFKFVAMYEKTIREMGGKGQEMERMMKKKLDAEQRQEFLQKISRAKKTTKGLWDVVKGFHNSSTIVDGKEGDVSEIMRGGKKYTEGNMAAVLAQEINRREIPDESGRWNQKKENQKAAEELESRGKGTEYPATAGEPQQHHLAAAIFSQNVSSAPGPDRIFSWHIRNMGPEGRRELLEIIQEGYRAGKWPKNWKRERCIPIPKGKNESGEEKFRPISLTSILSKVGERTIWLFTDEVAEGEMGGSGSSEDTITAIIARAKEANEEGKEVTIAGMDFSQAFENVPAECTTREFLKKAGKIGQMIDPGGKKGVARRLVKTARWLEEFCNGRSREVDFQGYRTQPETPVVGIPQGTYSGPRGWEIFAGGLQEELARVAGEIHKAEGKKVWVFFYVDDITVCIEEGGEKAERILQRICDAVTRWGNKNNMTTSEEKSWYMVTSPAKEESQQTPESEKLTVYLGGKELRFKENPKILGVVLDRALRFKKHGEMIMEKANKRLNAIKIMGKDTGGGMESEIRAWHLRILWRGWGESLFRYAAPATFGSMSKESKKRIEQIQYEAAKVITGLGKFPVNRECALRAAGLMHIEDLVACEEAAYVGRAMSKSKKNPLRQIWDEWEVKQQRQTGSEWDGWVRRGERWIQETEVGLRDCFVAVDKDGIRKGSSPKATTLGNVILTEEMASEELIRAIGRKERVLYTDGSVRNYYGATSMVEPDLTFGGLNMEATPFANVTDSFDTEREAICRALRRVEITANRGDRVVILTDSLSNIKAMKSPRFRDAEAVRLDKQIVGTARKVGESGRIEIRWVRGHSTSVGNWIADKIAGEVTECENCFGENTSNGVTVKQIKMMVAGEIRLKRAEKLREMAKWSKTAETLVRSIGLHGESHAFLLPISREEEKRMFRAQLDLLTVNFKGEFTVCGWCGMGRGDTEHFLKCPVWWGQNGGEVSWLRGNPVEAMGLINSMWTGAKYCGGVGPYGPVGGWEETGDWRKWQ